MIGASGRVEREGHLFLGVEIFGDLLEILFVQGDRLVGLAGFLRIAGIVEGAVGMAADLPDVQTVKRRGGG